MNSSIDIAIYFARVQPSLPGLFGNHCFWGVYPARLAKAASSAGLLSVVPAGLWMVDGATEATERRRLGARPRSSAVPVGLLASIVLGMRTQHGSQKRRAVLGYSQSSLWDFGEIECVSDSVRRGVLRGRTAVSLTVLSEECLSYSGRIWVGRRLWRR